MPIGGEVQLVGIALITINQRDRHILVAQATITNKCHSLYVALVSFGRCCDSDLLVHQAHMDGWMDIFAPPIHVFLSLAAPSADRQSHQSENHHDSTNERSLNLRHRGCSVLSTRKSKVRAFSSCTIRSNRHTAMITAAMVLMSTEQPNARASTPSSQRCKAAGGYQDPSTTSCDSGGIDRDDRCMVRVFPSIRESRSTSELTRSRSAQAHTLIRGEFIGVFAILPTNRLFILID